MLPMHDADVNDGYNHTLHNGYQLSLRLSVLHIHQRFVWLTTNHGYHIGLPLPWVHPPQHAIQYDGEGNP